MRAAAAAFLGLLLGAGAEAHGQAVTRSFFVPIVLSSAGARGSFFTSELTLTNRGPAAAAVALGYQAAIGEGNGEVFDSLAPGQQKIVPDAIAYLRSLGMPIPPEGNRGGTLRVTFRGLATPADAFVTVRTTTAVPEGRAGLAYSGVTPASALTSPRLLDDGPLVSGSYRASAYEGTDALPPPAPAAPRASLAVFGGTDPNGTFSLFVSDDAPEDTGQIAGGWCLEITTTEGAFRRQCSTTAIQIPANGTGSPAGAAAGPYPSTVTVSGLTGRVARLAVTLDRFSHAWPDDVDVALAGPGGQAALLMSDAGGEAASNVTLTFDDVASAAYLCGLRQNDTDRSNVAFVNTGGDAEGPITLRVTVFSGNPVSPVSRTLPDETLPPGGFRQLSGVLADVGLTSGYVRIERVAGTAPWYAYAAINDQGNSDGSFVPPLPSPSGLGSGALALPVAVEAGSFTTELVVANVSASARAVTLTYVSDNLTTTGRAVELPLSLAAFEQVVFPDFVAHLRARGVAGVPLRGVTLAGSVFATVAGGDVSGLFLGGRTSSPGGGGRYGVFYTAVPAGGGLNDSAWVYGLQQDGENRTNLAIVNTGEEDASTDTFRIEVYDGGSGQLAGAVDDVVLAPRRWTQLGSVLGLAAPGTGSAYARILRTSGSNPFLAYTVVNDGAGPGARSGDGAFVTAQPDCSYSLSAERRAFGWSGGATSAALSAPPGCDWTAESDAPWLTVLQGDGLGSGDVEYALAPNTGGAARAATLTAGGRRLAVAQLADAAGPYDGVFTGTTSQQRPITFTVAKNEVTSLGLGLSATVGGCSFSTDLTLRPSPPLVVENAAFAASLRITEGTTSFDLDLSGAFLSPTQAVGDGSVPLIVADGTPCTGAPSTLTWTSSR